MTDARAAVHAMFPLDEAATAELDARLDALIVEVRRTDADYLLDQRRHHIRRAIFCDGIKHAARLLQQRAGETTEKAVAPAAVVAPDFFQVGHAYTHRHGYDFRCFAVTTHPTTGERLAIGWHSEYGVPITVGINQWNHEYDGVEAPVAPEAGQ